MLKAKVIARDNKIYADVSTHKLYLPLLQAIVLVLDTRVLQQLECNILMVNHIHVLNQNPQPERHNVL